MVWKVGYGWGRNCGRKEGGGGVWNDNEWRVEKEKQMRVCMNHVEVVVPMQPPQALNDECDGGGGAPRT